MIDLIFPKFKPDIKNIDLTLNCEKRELNLETEIPPATAYTNREYSYPRYIHTGRPKSYMIQMCKKIVSESEFCRINSIFLPVIRYQSLYHTEYSKKNFCGTFFYFELESTVLLNLGKSAMFATKAHAYIVLKAFKKLKFSQLRVSFGEESKLDTYKEKVLNDLFNLDFHSNDMIDIWIKFKEQIGIFDVKQIQEIMIQFYIPLLYNENDVKQILGIETTALYPTDKAKYFYSDFKDRGSATIHFGAGSHDDFDQEICKMARDLNIDTLILQHEIGETRAVTEILDTREDSYENLVRIDTKKELYKVNQKYPTIFFLDNGFITNMKCNKIDIDRDNLNILKCI
jgi:hypothetical protein